MSRKAIIGLVRCYCRCLCAGCRRLLLVSRLSLCLYGRRADRRRHRFREPEIVGKFWSGG